MDHTDNDIAYCSACNCAMDVAMLQPFTNVQCPDCGEHNRVKSDVGKYVLMKRQGVGGMSLVFGAVDKTLGREAAIKILNEEYSMDEKRINQFELEAKITAAMSHPHIVKVFTVGQAFERFFIAMELVTGDSLEQKMNNEGKLPESDILRWAQQVADGLNAANEAGLIHRDIKPGNILFDKDENVKIVDFGLALVTQGGKAQADEIWATPYYVPPEVLDAGEEDFRSDIYALGASLFHALSGQPPFTTETRSTTELKEIKKKLPSLKEVAPWLSNATCMVIDKAMAFDMDNRHISYQELIHELQYAETVVNKQGDAQPIHSAERIQRKAKEDQAPSWMKFAVIGVATLLGGGIIYSLAGNGEKIVEEPHPNIIQNIGGNSSSGDLSRRVGMEITLARGSLKNRNYEEAAKRYERLSQESDMNPDTAYWSALQATTIRYLQGSPGRAKATLLHMYEKINLDGVKSPIISRLTDAKSSMLGLEKIEASSFPKLASDVDAILCCTAGMKNWSSGHVSEALNLFNLVKEYKTTDDLSDELIEYRSHISKYEHDAILLNRFNDDFHPQSEAEIKQRISQLDRLKPKFKTKGRVHFNLNEWYAQCEIHKKRLLRVAREASELKRIEQKQKILNEQQAKLNATWEDLLKSIDQKVQAYEFTVVEEVLRLTNLTDEKDKLKKQQMQYICRNAEGYLMSLRENLKSRSIRIDIETKDNIQYEGFKGTFEKGLALVKNGETNNTKWAEIYPGDLVDLFKHTVDKDLNLSDFEKNIRLEQAICFAWITGEYSKAKAGAKQLLENSEDFEDRWNTLLELME